MIHTIVIIERPSKHFTKFLNLLTKENEINIKDLKKIISHSSYYSVVIERLCNINKAIREIHPDLYLAEPNFHRESKKILTSIKKCGYAKIEQREGCFIVKYKNAA